MTASPPPAQPHPLEFLPNVLTISRIILIPFIVAGIVLLANGQETFLGRPTVLISLFVIAGLTDFLDGFLARRWNVVSDFGRMIDPIADKLLVAGCLIGFCVITRGDPYRAVLCRRLTSRNGKQPAKCLALACCLFGLLAARSYPLMTSFRHLRNGQGARD